MVLKRNLLDQVLDGQPLDPLAVIREPLVVHEAMTIFKVLEQFKKAPVRLAMIVDEYGEPGGNRHPDRPARGIAGNLPDVVGEAPEAVEREDGSLLDRWHDVGAGCVRSAGRFRRPRADSTPMAGFVLSRLGHLPVVGEHFDYEGWRFEVVDLDGRRIDKVLAVPPRAESVSAEISSRRTLVSSIRRCGRAGRLRAP